MIALILIVVIMVVEAVVLVGLAVGVMEPELEAVQVLYRRNIGGQGWNLVVAGLIVKAVVRKR